MLRCRNEVGSEMSSKNITAVNQFSTFSTSSVLSVLTKHNYTAYMNVGSAFGFGNLPKK